MLGCPDPRPACFSMASAGMQLSHSLPARTCAVQSPLLASLWPSTPRPPRSTYTLRRIGRLSTRQSRATREVVIRATMGGTGMGLQPELKSAIEKFIASNKVVLFMKGNKQFPQCGFSNTCVQILSTLNVPFETVNILEDELLRSGMKEYSQWPTFPQVYIDGEFYGGCDIMIESYTNGSLQEHLEAVMNS